MKRYDYDLIVIGSGAGGGVGASLAAARGKKVALFEKGAIGGECPNYACVPTKALLQAAETFQTVKNSGDYGIAAHKVDLDYSSVRHWKNLVVSRTGTAQGEKVFTDDGIDVIKAKAVFNGPRSVEADGRTYRAKKFLIAAGSETIIPPIAGLKESGYITFQQAVDFKKLPESIFIIGGGPIGCEFAQLFSDFGVKVGVADIAPGLLPRDEPEAGELIAALFRDRGIEVLSASKVNKIQKRDKKKTVHYEMHGHDHTMTVDEVLVATGKRGVTDLGLDYAGIKYDHRGIKYNSYLRTSNPHVYVAGDAAGPYMFTHTAAYQSRIAVNNAFYKRKRRPNYLSVPRVTFVSPEVASVGLTSEMAAERNLSIRVGTAPVAILGRANTSNTFDGFVKVITDRKRVILGATIVAPRAGEMIHELALAVKLRATADEVADLVHAFPTYSEAVKMACAAVE